MMDEHRGERRERFPLRRHDEPAIASIIILVRSNLRRMAPFELRAAAVLLLALERLPATTPGTLVRLGFKKSTCVGSYKWADISISDTELRMLIGEHFYESDVGGDTESSEVFAVDTEGSRHGSLSQWLECAHNIVFDRYTMTASDDSFHDELDWAGMDDRIDW